MKKLFLFLFALFLLSESGAGEKPFARFRQLAAGVQKRSQADYALGRELAKAMQQEALKRKSVLYPAQLYFETVLWRSSRLWFTAKYWRDRALINNRKYFFLNKSWEKNGALSYRLMKEYDADGCNIFVIKSAGHIHLDAAGLCGLSPEEFKLLPTVSPQESSTYWQMPDSVLKRLVQLKHTWKIDNKPVYLTYYADNYKDPKGLKAFFDNVKKRSGHDLYYIADLSGNNIRLYPDTDYARFRAVAATDLLRYFDHITDYLEDAAGVEYGVYLGKQDLNQPYEYFDEVLLPLVASACGQKKFNGKKILALKVVGNYTNSNGSQTVYANGTKTLRGYLELCRKYKVDLIQGFEWDENNENTNLEPTVAKPMAYKRIFRYYMGLLKGRKAAPLPGDDLTRPNLIVSTRRQIGAGEELELELLNVPDGNFEDYTVAVELFDQRGKTVYRSKDMAFSARRCYDQTLCIPTEKYPDSLFLQPRIIVTQKGNSKSFEGLPPVVVRGTTAEDHTWFSTPLRNLLTAQGSVQFTEGMPLYPGVREVGIEADMTFDDKLISAEVVQDSQDIFVHDPEDECQTSNGMNRLFKLYLRTTSPAQLALQISLPGALKLDFSTDPSRKAKLSPLSGSSVVKMSSSSRRDEFFILPGAAIPGNVLEISGKRLNGKRKGEKFSLRFELEKVLRTGISSQSLPEGVQFALEADPRPPVMALELQSKKVAFAAVFPVNSPVAVTSLRMVSRSGKIYWSRAYALNSSGKQTPVSVLSSKRGVVDFTLPRSRVPHIVYDFNQKDFGTLLPTDSGREFYANIGGFLSVATGFEGVLNAFNMPRVYAQGAETMPVFRTDPRGKRYLVFNGKDNHGIYFPKTAVPQRHGFTLVFDLKISDIQRDQIIFEQRSVHSYLTGFMIRLTAGKLHLEYNCREPHKNRAPLFAWKKYSSNLTLKPGVRQKLILRWDGRTATLEAGGKKAVFPAEAMGYWLTPSAFGGRGNERFAGELYGIEFIHSPNYK